MRIYTRTGDDGSTGLLSGQRTRKSDLRLECYGTIDELSAAIGLAVVVSDTDLKAMLRQIQNELLVIGSHVATAGEQPPANLSIPAIEAAFVARLEAQIDAAESELPPLRQFILAGGCEPAARLHLARTICRRAERLLVACAQNHALPPIIITYLNRLSDWLFVHARLANKRAGVEDILWTK
jgi:cob(I)alamin adenosyltransferase